MLVVKVHRVFPSSRSSQHLNWDFNFTG